MTLDMGFVILLGSGLSFLGLGAQPPTPDLGTMVAEGTLFLPDLWWTSVFSGLAILVVVLGFNLLGDGPPRPVRRGGVDEVALLEIKRL